MHSSFFTDYTCWGMKRGMPSTEAPKELLGSLYPGSRFVAGNHFVAVWPPQVSKNIKAAVRMIPVVYSCNK